MISTPGLSVKFLKRESYSGSYSGMRYTIKKSDEGLIVYAYSEPWAFESTPENERLAHECAFSDDGVKEAIDWLENLYTKNRRFWDTANKNKMANMLAGKHIGIPE